MTTNTTARYAAVDSMGIVWGLGATEDAAMSQARELIAQYGVRNALDSRLPEPLTIRTTKAALVAANRGGMARKKSQK